MITKELLLVAESMKNVYLDNAAGTMTEDDYWRYCETMATTLFRDDLESWGEFLKACGIETGTYDYKIVNR